VTSVPKFKNTPSKTTSGLPNWAQREEADCALRNIFFSYLKTPTYYILADEITHWQQLYRTDFIDSPIYFEFFLGKWKGRRKYNQAHFKRALQEKTTVVERRFGFYDIVTPVLSNGKCRGFLATGQVYKNLPSYEDLAKTWHEMTGQFPSTFNLEFIHYVKLCLRSPVFEGPSFSAFISLLEDHAALIAGEIDPMKVVERADKMKDEIFSKYFPHDSWLAWAMGENRFYPTPWWELKKLSDWEKQEIGIQRIPTTVLAIMLLDPQRKTDDPARALVQGAHLHRECFHYAKNLPETVGGRINDYSAVLITSASPGKNRLQAKLEIQDRAQKIIGHLREKFGMPVYIGIGQTAPVGQPLFQSFQEAMTALQFGVHLNQNIVFYAEQVGKESLARFSRIKELSENMKDAFSKLAFREMELLRDKFVQQSILYFHERIEAVRAHFLHTLFELMPLLEKRVFAQPELLERFSDSIEKKFEQAGSVYELITAFKQSIDTLGTFLLKPSEGSRKLRLEKLVEYVRGNFQDDLSLKTMARQWGFPVASLSREFTKHAGMSFNLYVQTQRLQQAQKLLKTTPLTVSQISRECGYNSANYFVRVFHRETGMTPNRFRDSEGPKEPLKSN